MNLKDMKISTRLVLGFGILTLLIALMGGVSMVKSGHVAEAFDKVVNDRYAKIAALNDIKEGLNQVARSLRNSVIMSNPAEIREQLAQAEEIRHGMAEHWNMLHATMRSEQGKALLASAEEARSRYVVVHQKFVGLIGEGRSEEAKALLLGDLRPVQLAYFAGVDALIAFQKAAMDTAAQQTFDEIAGMKAMIWVFGAIAVVVAVLMAVWIIRAIGGPLAQAVAIARAVADGDLSRQFAAEGSNETAQLLRALKDMQDSLARVVSHVRQNAEALASATGQISLGNADLAQRTEEQAAALEETAASMEQLTGTVRNNADNAHQASALTTSASDIARRGGEVVGRVVETMQGISASSAKVAEIISVIEGIAFQTNILALNAAVEAARAGEQGHGFTVVAGEIRALAQRSATAAKEIQTLIGDSVTRVNAGAKLVDEAGSTMGEVVRAVQRVTDMMGEIATASSEQSTGIEQVNTAVTQMEQMTQQNAALVEQASAAAQSLVEQAESLRSAVAVFKIAGQGDSVVAAAARQAPRPAAAAPQAKAADQAKAGAALDDWETF